MNKISISLLIVLAAALLMIPLVDVSTALAPVNLGTAGNFTILAKTGISATGITLITGDIGVSPVAATYITGFGLIMDASGTFSTSSLVVGNVYAADYTDPTPSMMTTAVSDMETAYTDAAGRPTPDYTELYAGDVTGRTLTPGLYKWGTGVLISAGGVTISGSPSDVWIFQIAQDLDLASGAIVTLSGGAQASNIFWQVAGQVTLGTTAAMNGIILCQTAIVISTGATLTGRALAQSAVTLDASTVTRPSEVPPVFPRITVDPMSVAFGDVDTAPGSRPATYVHIGNGGSAWLRNIRMTLLRGTDFALGSMLLADQLPGALDSVRVIFTSRARGAHLDTIRITSDDPTNGMIYVPVTGNGVHAGIADIDISPLNWDFGSVDTGGPRPSFHLRVSNLGTATLTGIALSLRGGTAYSLSQTSLPDLAAGGRDSVLVTLTGRSIGTFQDTISVTSSDPDEGTLRVPLLAVGSETHAPLLTVTPTWVDFGEVETSAARPTAWVHIGNGGTATLTSLRISLLFPAGYSVTPGTLPNLSPGGSDSVLVTFTSRIVGTYPDTLLIYSNDMAHNPYRVPLNGMTTVPARLPDITIAPEDLDFGEVDAGVVRPSLYLYIGNVGTGILTDITLNFSHGAVFSIDRMTLPDLASDVTDSVRVTFDLRTVGTWTDSLRVQSNDPDRPDLWVTVRGENLFTSVELPSLPARPLLSMRPNPASDRLWLSLGAAPAMRVDWSVRSLLGQILTEGAYPLGLGAETSLELDVSSWPAGVYWIIGQAGRERTMERVVIVR